jgi:hypothetical protein
MISPVQAAYAARVTTGWPENRFHCRRTKTRDPTLPR